jgi:hypothetical protein
MSTVEDSALLGWWIRGCAWLTSCLHARFVLRLCCVCLLLGGLLGADPVATSTETVDEQLLPHSQITAESLQGRVMIPLDEYQRLKQLATLGRTAPTATRLIKAEYAATFSDHRFTEGRLIWNVEHPGTKAESWAVQPLGLAVKNLQWGTMPAIWGTSGIGRFEVLLDRPQGQITGMWELDGETVVRHDEFLLKIPQATVSALKLRIPVGYSVVVPGPADAQFAAAEVGWNLWSISLGTQTECRIAIHPPQPPGVAWPLILVRSESWYGVRQEGLRYSCELSLEVSQAPVRDLVLTTDTELEVYSITYGDIPLPWKTETQDGVQRLSFMLPDLLLGTGRTLRLRGVAPIKTDQPWKLPQVSVVGGAFDEGQALVRLAPPLQLQRLETVGYLQNNIETSPTRDDLLTFKQFRPDGAIHVTLGKPRARVLARVLSDLQTKSSDWSCVTQLQLTAAEGSAFELKCRIPTGWDVTDVRDVNSPKLEWSILSPPSGERLLALHLLEALAPDKPRTIEIDARRGAGPTDQMFAIPAFEPLGIDGLQMLVALSSPAEIRPVLEAGTSFEPCEEADLDSEWTSSKLWQSRLADRKQKPLLLRLNGPAPEGHVTLQSLQTPIEVSAEMRIHFTSEKMTKTVLLKVSPQHGRTERVLVYQSEPGPQLSWVLAGTPSRPVEARKLPTIRNAAWDLPSTGELWELRLPQPQATPFELEGIRTRGLPPTGRLGLVFVPQAQTFRGQVSVEAPADLGLELTAEKTEADGVTEATPGPLMRTWTFHQAGAALEFQTRVAAAQVPAPVIRRVALEARWTLEPGKYDYYLAKLELGSGFRGGELPIGLPDHAEAIEIEIDGQPIQFEHPAPGEPLVLTNVTDQQVVAISYRAPGPDPAGPVWRGVLLPQLKIPVLRFDLELLTPAGYRLGGEARGMVLKSNTGSISALQRLFGPLGRPNSDTWFNPLSAQQWSDLFAPSGPAAEKLDSKATLSYSADSVHVGWQVFRGSAALLPERVEVWLWSTRQATCAAWLAFWGCLLVGGTLRLARLPNRGILGSTALMGEILLSFVLPSVPAQIVGACLAGTLLATLWPRAMISLPARRPPGTDPQIPQGSTQSYQAAPGRSSSQQMALWGWIAALSTSLLFLGTAIGAEPLATASTVHSQTAIQPVYQVVIPVDAQAKPLVDPAWAYVPSPLLKDWSARYSKQALNPTALIQAGEYTILRDPTGQVRMTAGFDVLVLSTANEIEVAFPLTGINFGGENACLVDGKPQPVLTSTEARVLFLRLAGAEEESKPAAPPMPETPKSDSSPSAETANVASQTVSQWPVPVRKYHVEFQGYPVLHSVAGGSWMEFTVPKLNAARLTVRNSLPDGPWMLQLNGRPLSIGVDQPLTMELGPIAQLRIETLPSTTVEMIAPKLEVRLAALADVQPALTRMSYQAKYTVTSGRVSGVIWQLPPRLVVRQVVGPEIFDWRVEATKDGGSRLRIDFRAPIAEGFFVRVDAISPQDGPASQAVSPPVHLLAPNLEPLRPLVSLVGIRAPSEFLVEAPADVGEQIATTTVDEFLKERNDVDQRPQLAFRLLDPAPLKVGLKLLSPHRIIRMSTVGVLGSRQLQWNVNATIEVQNAAAFSHQLEVDPRLVITNVGIQEDAANRLLRWTRSGNLLQVFLRDKTTGTQTLSLQGTMPTQIPQELALPTLKFQDATLADAKLQLYQEPDLEVEVVDPNKWERLEAPAEVRFGAARNLLVGRFKWPENAGPFVVRAAQNEPVLSYSAVTSIQPWDGRWKLTTNLLFQVEKGHGSQFSIRVPPELPLVRIDAGDVRQLPDKEPDGGQRWGLIPPSPVRDRFVVQVSGYVNLPTTGLATIPEIVGLNATKRDHFIVLPEEAHLTVDSRTSGLIPAQLPENLATLRPADLQSAAGRQFRGLAGAWTVSIPRHQEESPQAGVLWTETQIWCGPTKHLAGRTTTVMGPQELENLEFTIPAGISVQGVLLDGDFIPHSPVLSQSLKIPLTFPQAGHILTLYWTEEMPPFEGWTAHSEVSWPRVVGQSVSEQYVTLTPPTGFRARTGTGQSVERISVQLGELAVILQLMQRRAADGPEPLDGHWKFLQHRAANLMKRLQSEPRMQSRMGELSERLARLQTQFAPWAPVSLAAIPVQDELPSEPEVPRPFASLDGNLAGPHSLLIKFAPGAPQSKLMVSMINESLWSWSLGLLIGLGVLLLVWPLLRWKFPEWLAHHPAIAWLLLGSIWWGCLRPSVVGLVCLGIAVILILRKFPWTRMQVAEQEAI